MNRRGFFKSLAAIATAAAVPVVWAKEKIQDWYIGKTITTYDGRGHGVTRKIVAYDGTTKVVTLSGRFYSPPDESSIFTITNNDS
jgi:hypothetical protein